MREYITKLNDRNLQRKKATGITNYVLYSLMGIVLFKIIDLTPTINYDIINSLNFIKIIWYSFCLSFSIYYFYLSFILSFKADSSLRILKFSKKEGTFYSNIITILISLTTIIPALLILWESIKSNYFNYSAPEIILFILTGWILIVLSFTLNPEKNDLFKEISRPRYTDRISKIFLGFSLALGLISTLLLFKLEINDSFLIKNLILICLLFFSFLVISERITISHQVDLFSRDLEDLEYEIYVKNLSDEEIRVVLQTNYMGFLIKDWIKSKEIEIDSAYQKHEKDRLLIQTKETKLNDIDKVNYPIEFQGREDEIKILKVNLKKEKEIFFTNNINEIKEIIKKDSNIETIELNRLREMELKLSLDNK